MLSIIFNPSMLRAQNILNKTNNSLVKSLERLSTGLHINSAADDPAGYYVAQGVNSKIRCLKQAQNNILTGSSILSTAENALQDITNKLDQLNNIALEATNSNIDSSQRSALQKEATDLVNQIKNINRNTTFNGLNVFGSVGNFSTAVAHVTPALAATVPLAAPAATPAATPAAAYSVATPTQNAATESVSTSSPPPERLKRTP